MEQEITTYLKYK